MLESCHLICVHGPLNIPHILSGRFVYCFLHSPKQEKTTVQCSQFSDNNFGFYSISEMCAYAVHMYPHLTDKTTERRGRVVNTPATYTGGPEFEFRPTDRLS
jgi:hypothetical protein